MKMYIIINGATIVTKRLFQSFVWKNSEMTITKRADSTLDNPLYTIEIIGGFKLEMRDDDSRLRIAPINTNLGWVPLDSDMYEDVEAGYMGGANYDQLSFSINNCSIDDLVNDCCGNRCICRTRS